MLGSSEAKAIREHYKKLRWEASCLIDHLRLNNCSAMMILRLASGTTTSEVFLEISGL